MRRVERKQLAEPIAEFFSKEGGIEPKLEYRFTGASRFDVLGYNPQERVIYLAECKMGKGVVRLGKTFGQLIAYIQLISSNGWDFVHRVHDDLNWFKLTDVEHILATKKLPMKFYVAFSDQDAKTSMQFLTWTHEQFLNRKIGIILVENRKPRIIEDAAIIDVPIRKTYHALPDFFEDLKEKVNADLEIKPKKVSSFSKKRYRKFVYNDWKVHFEVWFKRRTKVIEVGLHMEAAKDRNELILKELRKRQGKIKQNLPNIVMGKFSRKNTSWKKAVELLPWGGRSDSLDEELLSKVKQVLRNYVITLKPILDSIDWGKTQQE